MPDHLRSTAQYAQIQKERWRLFWTLLAGPTVAWSLYVSSTVFFHPNMRDAPPEGASGWLLLSIVGFCLFGIVFVVPIIAIISAFIYEMLRRFNRLSAKMILAASVFQGLAYSSGLVLLADTIKSEDQQDAKTLWSDVVLNLMLPITIGALIGGLIFCRMTIWRKQETDGASDV